MMVAARLRRMTCAMVLAFGAIVTTDISATSADVRLGKNVRIGGHDASNQTFTRQKRGLYIIQETKPKNAGCTIRRNRDGSRTKVCRLQRKPVTDKR